MACECSRKRDGLCCSLIALPYVTFEKSASHTASTRTQSKQSAEGSQRAGWETEIEQPR